MKLDSLPSLALLVTLVGTPVGAEEWAQWRGPARDGKSTETGLLQEWPEGGPPLAWTAAGLGTGYSSVSISDGRIFTMGDLEDGQYAFALKGDGSEILWKTLVGPKHEDRRGGPRSTPTVDGERVFVLSTSGEISALEAATGKIVWHRNLPEDFGAFLMKAMGSYDWRFAESPLVDGDKVVVTPGHVEAVMVALDKATGEEIWKTRGRRLGPIGADGAAYSSVVVSEATGRRQYVQLVGRGLIGVDAESGEMLWNYNRVASDIANIATPLVHGDYVFASAGYGTGSALIKIVPGEEGLEAQEVYFLEAGTLQNHHGGLILHDGTVFTGTGHNKGFPIAVDFESGEVLWGPARNSGADSAAILWADGRLYFRYRDGQVFLIESSRDEYREKGSFQIPDVKMESWSHPVIVGGKLYLREQDRLLCYDIRAPKTG